MEIKLVKKSESPLGLDALISLSYSAAAASSFVREDRRKLLFSLYCLRCIFDNTDLLDPPALLTEYGCCFLFPTVTHPSYAKNPEFFRAAAQQKDAVFFEGGLLVGGAGAKKLKFDAGSPLFNIFVSRGIISGDNAKYPDKFNLLEGVDVLLSLENTSPELKSLWFLLFPFLLGKAPDSGDNLDSIKERLFRHEVYAAAAGGDYARIVPPDPAMTFAAEPFLAAWFAEYSAWRAANAPDSKRKIFSVPPFAKTNNASNKPAHDFNYNSIANGVQDNAISSQKPENLAEIDKPGADTPLCADASKTNTTSSSATIDPYKEADSLKDNSGTTVRTERTSSTISNSSMQNSKEEFSTTFGAAGVTFDEELSQGAQAEHLRLAEQAAIETRKVLDDAERMFAENPDNEEVFLLLLAARTNQPPAHQSPKTLADNVSLISARLPSAKRKAELAYFMGLSFLGLRHIDRATRAFTLCLKFKPDFAPAQQMLTAINKAFDS